MQYVSTHRFALDADVPDNLCGIYVVEHKESSRVYVGQTGGRTRNFKRRCIEHIYHAKRLEQNSKPRGRFHPAVRKYGPDAFIFHVAEVIQFDADSSVFDRAEERLIRHLDASGTGGFNVNIEARTPRGVKFTEQARKNMSEARRKMLAEKPELANSLRKRLTERNKSEASRAAAASLNSNPEFQTIRQAALRAAREEHGSVWSKKMSEAWTDEMREASRLRGIASADKLRKEYGCAVVCIDTGERFNSIREAAAKYGRLRQGLTSHLNGRLKQFCGLQWKREVSTS